MGNTSSSNSGGGGKKVTREERKKTRENVEHSKEKGLQARKDDISRLQGEILNSNGDGSEGNVLERSVMVVGDTKMTAIQFINATEAAKVQLDRGGGPFTKTDLVAIAMALSTSNGNKVTIESLRALTIPDLNAYIRTVVYDPSRFLAPASNTSSSMAVSLLL